MGQKVVDQRPKAIFDRMTAGTHEEEIQIVIFFEAVEVAMDDGENDGENEDAIRLVFEDRTEITVSEDGMAHHLPSLSEFVQRSWRGNTEITARIYKKDGVVERVALYGSSEQYRKFYAVVDR